MEDAMFEGDIYVDKNVGELLAEIFSVAKVPYEIAEDIASMTVSGHIPYCTCRKALMLVAFATLSVVDTSNLLNTKLIVAATMSGKTARLISNLRPRSLILASTPSEKVARGLALNAGVYPVITKEYESTDEIVNDSIVRAKEFTNIEKDDLLIITGGFPNNSKTTNFMKVEKI
jgi:pyruvate kinase